MDMDVFWKEFREGNALNAYEFFGAHVGADGTTFRTYAPNASGVNLFGDFNSWTEVPMERDEHGCFSITVKEAKKGDLYKYVVYGNNGWRTEHADPYAFGAELRPGSASRITDLSEYRFGDAQWLKGQNDHRDKPMAIYEVHLGAFMRNPDEEHGWYSYREIAEPLIEHVKKCGYTHIELMPLCEYPFDGSWGYQLSGYFAATCRYGSPADLKYLIDCCHKAGIGVIMDYVPVHFAIDDFALKLYDTTALYEYYRPGVAESQWGTCMFNHERPETVSFLLSAAEFWVSEYHVDGLRVDAVSCLIYWGGRQEKGENPSGMAFARKLTGLLKKKHPKLMLFAEDSSSWQGGVTAPVEKGGLGFDYKWDMGWMYDSLYFLSLPVEQRRANYHKLTFSMWYFYDERFILSLSHDEVVGGRGTILEKMHGSEDSKIAQIRAYYAYMYMHPGKKLSFMGNEVGERTEWNETREVEFNLLAEPLHKGLFDLVCDLQKLYCSEEVLYAKEYERDNYEWLYCRDDGPLLYVMKRIGKGKSFVCALNFGAEALEAFELPLDKEEPEAAEAENAAEAKAKPAKKKSAKKEESWTSVICTDWKCYGGALDADKKTIRSDKRKMSIDLQPYSAVIYEVNS
ncbi:MAG: 1,4-alpha-glucan branching protein GlgB [Lachnospiraceae bacterium]|nr:1,4-alpha-glucan branching protein GlgB [Lachnospiraceae bacterium]